MRNQRFWVLGEVSVATGLKHGTTRSGACGLMRLNAGKPTKSRHIALSGFYGWWRMAVLSWWKEMSGLFR